ncbi:MAG: sec-independent protein translocase protein TatC [Pseudomonadota bacterium]|nr:sec-independent protein translocase protein TatC [Pseudomonadota bacterium]
MTEHLNILRRFAIEFLVVWLSLFVFVYWKIDWFFHLLLQKFGQSIPIIAPQILSPILIPLDLAIDISLFMAMPFALTQLWRFVAPALFVEEKNICRLILCFSICLLFFGLLFCWFWILPFLFSILNHGVPKEMVWMPSWQSYYEFILLIEAFFCLSFQIPLALVLLVRLGIISSQQLTQSRPYAIVIAFTVGMLVTPPDVGSQIVVAIPLCALYELGIRLSLWIERKSYSIK